MDLVLDRIPHCVLLFPPTRPTPILGMPMSRHRICLIMYTGPGFVILGRFLSLMDMLPPLFRCLCFGVDMAAFGAYPLSGMIPEISLYSP